MDKTFEDIIGEVTEEFNNENTNNEPAQTDTLESTPIVDEKAGGLTDGSNSDEDLQNENDDFDQEDLEDFSEEDNTPSMNEKDAQAFARMRTELKEANDINKKNQELIEFFDSRAKQMGLNGIDDLMEKTKESEMKKEAEQQGIPLDVLKRLNDLEKEVNNQKSEKEALQKIAREQAVDRVFDRFVQNNPMNDKQVQQLANDLLNDGFSLDALSVMPEGAINRILSAYLPAEVSKQETIAKKEQIKREVPATGNSSSNDNTEDMIDKIARQWAGL